MTYYKNKKGFSTCVETMRKSELPKDKDQMSGQADSGALPSNSLNSGQSAPMSAPVKPEPGTGNGSLDSTSGSSSGTINQ